LEALPRSEEAQRLAEEWRRLLDEIARAQEDAEESLREDILPRLRRRAGGAQKEARGIAAQGTTTHDAGRHLDLGMGDG
jgi:hypothetical protein